MSTIYDFSAKDLSGNNVDFSDFKDKVLLIVNTASKCGFTPQFEGLEKLHQQYKNQGLVVIGFPCNQFGSQDPGSNDEIGAFCQKNYGVDFLMMEKIDVNGNNEHPLYTWLKKQEGGFLTDGIKWNFTKFLVNRQGEVVERYAPTTKPESIESDIVKLLA
ncbi:glutathione peroxidase [Psychrobacter sanguinis]|uniref:glutathione peroxidase n=1 Tax=Psychrobacter sanguinis TaxID=861445 RepID=UPI00020C794A|nr:glutathione peroxidase [Psychrobacter sanguinis]EGK14971.1 glutathione peroxidase [Psychrobacter sp. 1501(2011)]MCD9151083.1 glutathione peroxidase [Psychrobacter sanguinis]HBH34626.1 glutathione peroxidase [Psychrobacter sp.]